MKTKDAPKVNPANASRQEKQRGATVKTAAVASDLSRMLTRELDCFQREVDLFPEDAGLWKLAPGLTNSVGTLAVHVAGNLRGMIGAVLGKSGYVRDREAEFSRRELTRREVKAELERAKQEIESVLRTLDDAALAAPWPGEFHGLTMPTGRFLLALEVHTAFHLGQAVCARRVVTGDLTSSHPIDTVPLAES